jgi:mRNA interferase MazF
VLKGNDLILCQITSKSVKDNHAIPVDPNDFASGSLNQKSNIRPNRFFTVDNQIVLYRIGNIKKIKLDQVINMIIEIIKE